MRWKVLVSAPYMQPVIENFGPIFSQHGIEIIIPVVHERLDEEELCRLVGDIDGAICGDDRFTERVLQMAPRLKVISKWGTGIDSIDQIACQRMGISVCNTPNAFTDPVADTVLGYILCFARQIPWMADGVRNGVWLKIPGRALRECTLGVIGVGNIGKAVVRRAIAFGMRVLGNDLLDIPKEFVSETGINMVSNEALLRQSDFISINCTLNSTSHHLINERDFEIMKSTAVIINTARGPIIDEAALVTALKEGLIAGAALDVFEIEPLPDDSPLRKMNNVLMAPHNSNSSPEAWEHVHWNSINNLVEELRQSEE